MATMTDSRPVLIVSTDRTRAEQLAEPLRNAGTTVTTETHGPAAAAALAAASVGVPGEGPGLLVLDLSLPELDLQRLREALGAASPPPEPLVAAERRRNAPAPRGEPPQGRPVAGACPLYVAGQDSALSSRKHRIRGLTATPPDLSPHGSPRAGGLRAAGRSPAVLARRRSAGRPAEL